MWFVFCSFYDNPSEDPHQKILSNVGWSIAKLFGIAAIVIMGFSWLVQTAQPYVTNKEK
jgi:hypothetical protein